MSMAADDVQCWTTEEVAKACGVAVAVERQKCIEAVCPSCREGKTLEWHQEWRKVGAGAIRGWLHVENRGMAVQGGRDSRTRQKGARRWVRFSRG
jgi:hypothetical protein